MKRVGFFGELFAGIREGSKTLIHEDKVWILGKKNQWYTTDGLHLYKASEEEAEKLYQLI